MKWESETRSRFSPLVQVRGSSLLIYDEPIRLFGTRPSLKRQMTMKQQRTKAYCGSVSQSSRKRLAKAVTIMSQAIKPKWITNPVSGRMQRHTFSFITLTIASCKNITARQAYDSCLSHFLDWMTRTIANKEPGAATYIWKAELQKRGQIHYHITTPGFIHYLDIRNKWNALQRAAGLLDEWAAQHGNFNPNSTDVHATYNVRHADRYLLKELGKTISAVQVEQISLIKDRVNAGELSPEDGDIQIQLIKDNKVSTIGKIWGCSLNLAGKAYYTIALTSAHEAKINQWIREKKVRYKADDFFAMIFTEGVDPPDLLSETELINFKTYVKTIIAKK